MGDASSSSSSSHSCARTARLWSQLGLDGRYIVASLPVLLVAMLSLGAWVTHSIEEQVIDNTAGNASLFVNSFVSPELQGLAHRQSLSEDEAHMLGTLLTGTPLGRRILSFKVWLRGGRIAYYSRDSALVGRVFPPSAKLRKAWTGKVAAELSSLEEAEAAGELKLAVPLLEVYMPVHEQRSDKIIAVAEFYEDATELVSHVQATRFRTWLAVAATMLLMYGFLFGIVHAGGRLIRRQAVELQQKVNELSELLAQNEALRERVGRATRRVTELNEGFLRRLSADLHDGPAQAVSLALLRLDRIALPAAAAGGPPANGGGEEIEQIRATLQEALREIRHLCRGLSLPEVADLGIAEVVARAAANHERRTRTAVETDLGNLRGMDAVSMPIKLTAYRFTQEALMNAFRHAQGKGQAVSARCAGGSLELRVSDRGGGIEADRGEPDRMGLTGLRERVESLGGRFEIDSAPGRGTTLLALLPLT